MKVTKSLKAMVAGMLVTNSALAQERKKAFDKVEVTSLRDDERPELCATVSLYTSDEYQSPKRKHELAQTLRDTAYDCGNGYLPITRSYSKHDSCHTDDESKILPHHHIASTKEKIECLEQGLRKKYKIPLPTKDFRKQVLQACDDSKSSGREL